MTYTHLHRDDPTVEVFRDKFAKLRRALGVTAFGINEVRMPPGFEGPAHDEAETRHEEVYVVLAGSGRAIVDGEQISLREGDYLRVDPDTVRQLVAGEDGLTFLVVGAAERAAYDGRSSL